MVLAIPFFAADAPGPALFVAYMALSEVKPHKRGYRVRARVLEERRSKAPTFVREVLRRSGAGTD